MEAILKFNVLNQSKFDLLLEMLKSLDFIEITANIPKAKEKPINKAFENRLRKNLKTGFEYIKASERGEVVPQTLNDYIKELRNDNV